MIKKVLLSVVAVLIAIQFIHPKKNESTGLSENDISKLYAVPESVQTILAKACYDCHSNNTVYPWYNSIQPIAWMLNNHIKKGKRYLNFSEFASYKISSQYKKLEQCKEQLKENEMPLASYTWIHRNAILTVEEKAAITDWCDKIRDSIKTKYPADSLILPKRR